MRDERRYYHETPRDRPRRHLGKNAYACFLRRYDANHLAQHPKQKIAAIKLLVAAEAPNEENTINCSFRLGVALVIYGQALRAFHSASANPDFARHVGQFSRAGIELAACGNTVKSQNVSLKDLLPGFVSAEKGGVVRLAELQSQGYLYLRP